MDQYAMGSDKNHAWWKGSFPTWIVVMLLAVCGFFLQRELELNDDCREKTEAAVTALQVEVSSLKSRITTLEQATAENHKLLHQISQNLNP